MRKEVTGMGRLPQTAAVLVGLLPFQVLAQQPTDFEIEYEIGGALVVLAERDTTSNIFVSGVCDQIERQARAFGLPPGFLARLIWKESRFDPAAISPAGAEGIAQFMPQTAAKWQLENPFDPMKAIEASARLLNHLQMAYGNLGLASAAYNAGERRVDAYRTRGRRLPAETRDYVYSITGHPVTSWRKGNGPQVNYDLDETKDFRSSCIEFRLVKAPLQRRFANTYFNRGLKLAKSGDWEAAILRYTVAIRLKPGFAHAFNNRGLVYRKLGQYDEAISNYSAAIRHDPAYANAYNNRGFAFRKTGKFEAAIRDYTLAIKHKPGLAVAWFNRGFAKARLNRFPEAITDYSMAIRLEPENPLGFYNRGIAHSRLGDLVNAKQDFDRAIETHQEYARAYYQRAAVLLELGNREQAEKDYRKSVRLNANLAKGALKSEFN